MPNRIRLPYLTRRNLLRTSLLGTAAVPFLATAGRATEQNSEKMRAAVITKAGSPVKPNIKIADDWPAPRPEPGWVTVRTLASTLNHLDLFIAGGASGEKPWVCGSDACGEIVALGEGVDESWLGKRVILMARVPQPTPELPGVRPPDIPDGKFIGMDFQGTHAERFTAPVTNLMTIDERIDPVEAAAFPLTYLTAYRMLTSRAQLQPDETVLLTGIGGGVAQASLDICRHIGSRIIVTSRRQHKLERAVERGANNGIKDTGQDWSKKVIDLTDKRGVNVCADSVAKAVHMNCLKSMATAGRFVTCGSTTGADITTDNTLILLNQISYLGSSMGSMRELREVTTLYERGYLKPEVDKVYPAEQFGDAIERLENAEQTGKIVIKWA